MKLEEQSDDCDEEEITCDKCSTTLTSFGPAFVKCSICEKSWHEGCLSPDQLPKEQTEYWKCEICDESVYVNAHIQ